MPLALIHHPGLKRQKDVPDKHVRLLARSGWLPGPLPTPRRSKVVNPPVAEKPAPESGDSPTPDQEV